MNLNERAELAYEHHIDNYGIDWGSECELFTTGYIAAIKQSIEMDFDQVKEANEYWAMVPDIGWRKGVIVGGGLGLDFTWKEADSWHVIRTSSVIRYCRVADWLPAPAEIFGGEQ